MPFKTHKMLKFRLVRTPSLAFKGHGIQGSLVKILPKIRVILVVN